MYRYIIKRLLLMIPVVLGVSFMIYFIMDLAPGNIVTVTLGDEASISKEEIAALYEK